MRTAELSTKQNYNQIDGVINNQPTVSQLEQDAKSGKPISFMALLDAHAGRKNSPLWSSLKQRRHRYKKKQKKNPQSVRKWSDEEFIAVSKELIADFE